MSLLLDALRKSEAQRRRGQAPGLELGPMPGGSRSARPARRWPALLLTAGIVGLVAWQWPRIVDFADRWRATAPAAVENEADRESATGRDGSGGVAGVVPAPNSQATAEARRAMAENEVATGEPDVPARPVVERSAGPPPRAPSAGNARTGASGGSDPGAAAEGPSARPSAAALQRAEAIRREAERARSATAGAGQPTAAAPGVDDDGAASRDGATASEAVARAPSSDRGVPAGADPERSGGAVQEDTAGYLRPWELPQGRRAAFPELDLTVHFYAEQPGERFVLINGERYGQGDRVEGEVRLREILRRGVVVEFGDYLVLVE